MSSNTAELFSKGEKVQLGRKTNAKKSLQAYRKDTP